MRKILYTNRFHIKPEVKGGRPLFSFFFSGRATASGVFPRGKFHTRIGDHLAPFAGIDKLQKKESAQFGILVRAYVPAALRAYALANVSPGPRFALLSCRDATSGRPQKGRVRTYTALQKVNKETLTPPRAFTSQLRACGSSIMLHAAAKPTETKTGRAAERRKTPSRSGENTRLVRWIQGRALRVSNVAALP